MNGLLFEAGIDHVNLYKLHKYVGLSTMQTERAILSQSRSIADVPRKRAVEEAQHGEWVERHTRHGDSQLSHPVAPSM